MVSTMKMNFGKAVVQNEPEHISFERVRLEQQFYDVEPDAMELRIEEEEDCSHRRFIEPSSSPEIPFSKLRQSSRKAIAGTLGQVRYATLIDYPAGTPATEVCIKTVRVSSDLKLDEVAKLIGILNCERLVKLHGCARHPDGYWLMVTEAALMPLNRFLTKRMDPKSVLLVAVKQIAEAMQYLESKKVIHRSLACRNVLVCQNRPLVCKVSDFGKSRLLGLNANYYHQTRESGQKPIKWYAPESLWGDIFDLKTDVWAFGITFWEVMNFGAVPYGNKSGIQVLDLIRTGGRLDPPTSCGSRSELSWCYELMQRCWTQSSEGRPNFVQIVSVLDSNCGVDSK